jgi:hypothetical protein
VRRARPNRKGERGDGMVAGVWAGMLGVSQQRSPDSWTLTPSYLPPCVNESGVCDR